VGDGKCNNNFNSKVKIGFEFDVIFYNKNRTCFSQTTKLLKYC